ncbi:MAG: hypothetical protein V3V78_04475 [Candidatus Woesearchaeota archaeon]
MRIINKLLIFLILIILSNTAYSVTKEDINLEIGESIVIGGRNFTLITIASNNKMIMKIDNEKYFLSSIEAEHFDGIHIYPGLYYEKTRFMNESIDMNISMNYTCGNDKCETSWETTENCCIDCNCSANDTCYEKRCVKSEFIRCYRDAECKDEDECTEDYCSDFPKLCYNDKITECKHGDGCCPANCTAINDEDCYIEKPKCKTDDDCDDNNLSTIDKCSKITNWCSHELNKTKESETKEEVEVESEITGKTVAVIEKKSFFRILLDWLRGLF